MHPSARLQQLCCIIVSQTSCELNTAACLDYNGAKLNYDFILEQFKIITNEQHICILNDGDNITKMFCSYMFHQGTTVQVNSELRLCIIVPYQFQLY